MAKNQEKLPAIYSNQGLKTLLTKAWSSGLFIYNVGDFWCNGYVALKVNTQIEDFISRKMFRNDIDINARNGSDCRKKSDLVFESLHKDPLVEATISDFKFVFNSYDARVITTKEGNFLVNEAYLKPFGLVLLEAYASVSKNEENPPNLIFKYNSVSKGESYVVAVVLPIRSDKETQAKIDKIKHEPRK